MDTVWRQNQSTLEEEEQNKNEDFIMDMPSLKDDSFLQNKNGFCLIISLNDATTLYTTSSIKLRLGYPKDMLKGQCILKYLHPKDRLIFANHLSQGLQKQYLIKETKIDEKIIFYVRFREYKSLKGGYGVIDRKTVYKPFQLTCIIRDIPDSLYAYKPDNYTDRLVALALPINSAYKAPNEKSPSFVSFSSRHTSDCIFSHIDTTSIPLLGYLPQDIIGYSIFDFYHHEDLKLIYDIYQLVIKHQGSSYRSKPYRFKVFNGDYITLLTDWSSFINPWSRKMEFVIGHHQVLNGPSNIDIFEEGKKNSCYEPNLEEKMLQNEIKSMISKPLEIFPKNLDLNKKNKQLATFISEIIDGIGSPSIQKKLHNSLKMDYLGEAPLREDNYKSSFETNLSVENMRLKDNIERFFASQQKGNFEYFSDGTLSINNKNSHTGSGSNDSPFNQPSSDSGLPFSMTSDSQESGKKEFLNLNSFKDKMRDANEFFNTPLKKLRSKQDYIDQDMREIEISKLKRSHDSGIKMNPTKSNQTCPNEKVRRQAKNKNETYGQSFSNYSSSVSSQGQTSLTPCVFLAYVPSTLILYQSSSTSIQNLPQLLVNLTSSMNGNEKRDVQLQTELIPKDNSNFVLNSNLSNNESIHDKDESVHMNDLSTKSNESYESSFLMSDETFSSEQSPDSLLEKSNSQANYNQSTCWINNLDSDYNHLYQYQMKMLGIDVTLKNDQAQLDNMEQPSLVKKQLEYLHKDLAASSSSSFSSSPPHLKILPKHSQSKLFDTILKFHDTSECIPQQVRGNEAAPKTDHFHFSFISDQSKQSKSDGEFD